MVYAEKMLVDKYRRWSRPRHNYFLPRLQQTHPDLTNSAVSHAWSPESSLPPPAIAGRGRPRLTIDFLTHSHLCVPAAAMVYYFTSTVVTPSAHIYVGKDKFESASHRKASTAED